MNGLKKKTDLIYLIIGLLLPLVYIVLNELWLYGWYDANWAKFLPGTMGKIVLEDEYLLDAVFCLLLVTALTPLVVKLRREDLELGKIRDSVPMRGVNIVKTTVIAFGISGMSMVWTIAVDGLLGEVKLFSDGMEEFENLFGQAHGAFGYFWMLMSVAIFGPIVEEMIFRGVMFSALSRYLSGGLVVVITSVYFGIWHVNVIQAVYATLIGVVIGFVYLATENFWFPVIIHIINNSIETPPPFLENNETFIMVSNIIKLLAIIPALVLTVTMVKERKRMDKVMLQ